MPLAALFTGTAHAQVDLAGLNGTVSDPSGSRVLAAHITATQTATGLHRDTVSSATGTYDIPNLPIGSYRLTISAPGFQDHIYDNLQLTVGHTSTIDVRLGIASAPQVVTVEDTQADFDKSSDALDARTEPAQLKQLPLNGRNWSTLTALVPGAVDTGGSNQRTIRFAGKGLDDNAVTLDGIDATNVVNQAQQPFVRVAIPIDSIAEFQIDTMLFTAEKGVSPGGQIAVVTKTGSNQLHGSLFEYLRNDIFDARQPDDTFDASKPPFRLNQFGGSLGGPIVHDRSFYFFAYEGLRQTLGQTLPGFVPTDTFKAQVAAASPALVPVLNAYPKGTLPVTGSTQIAEFVGSGRQLDHEDSAILRLDQHFSQRNSAFLRFSFDAAVSDAPLSEGGSYLNDRQQISSRPVNGELEFLHIFSPTLINETRFGFNRGNVYTTNQSALNLATAVAVSGFTTLANNEYKVGVGNTFSYIDNLTLVHNTQTFKVGVEVRRIQLNQGNTANGTATFSSTASFLANSVSSASYANALPTNGLRKTEVYSYAQDEWKLRPNLTFNLGVRYTFFNLFHEVFGKAVPFDFATCGPQGFCGAGASFGNPNTLDIDPRVSFTWSPLALRNNTVLRGGFGLYHGDGQLDDQNLPTNNEVGQYSLSLKSTPALAFPITPFLNGPGTVSARDDDRTRKDSYFTEWGLSVQQALPSHFVNTLSYVGSKGTYLLTTSYVNLIDPATGLRPYPAFGQIQWRGNINNSSYQALVDGLQRNFTHGLLVRANYTWSHEIDQDAAGGGDSDYPQNPACLPCERASGDFDVRQVFSANVVYDLPFGPGRTYLSPSASAPFGQRAAAAVLGNWTISPIVTDRTGLPVNVTEDRSSSSVATGYTTSQRPNIVPGVSLTPPGGHRISGWINPAAFTLVTGSGYGDAPRNIARGPSLWQADLALSKIIPLKELAQLEFRGEFFNLFNRAQYGLPLADVSTSTFGQIIATVNTGPVGTGTPRQVQFALRLRF
ncbi:TonB-dependent receptor [Granulicella sp. 5B5]|uniref:TonB-dependent receptor n=1 Tax=Granulicella sp. 5B5 TaxID=1617967 RepID=UPI0015F3DA7F|nr:TonB-dependent receptor [Granulicella sp. 5B5]